jgi:hypothetical protein
MGKHTGVVVVETEELPRPHNWLLIHRKGEPPVLAVSTRRISAETAEELRRALGADGLA